MLIIEKNRVPELRACDGHLHNGVRARSQGRPVVPLAWCGDHHFCRTGAPPATLNTDLNMHLLGRNGGEPNLKIV